MYERRMKLEQINNRMEKIEEMQKERYLLDEERRKMEGELNHKKSIMLNRLSKIINVSVITVMSELSCNIGLALVSALNAEIHPSLRLHPEGAPLSFVPVPAPPVFLLPLLWE